MAETQRVEYENAKADVTGAEKALERQTQEVGKRIAERYDDHFLLNRIKAMFELVLNDWTMLLVWALFTLLLLLLELLIVVIKTKSEETNYERKIKAIEKIGFERMNRIVSKDNVFFDPEGLYQTVKNAKAKIEGPSPAIFS